jgi:hypothetical protein
MDAFDETLNFILERARDTYPVMQTLAAAPYNWMWKGVSPGNYRDQAQAVEDQIVVLAQKEAANSVAGALWDKDLDGLVADASLGTRLARIEFRDESEKLQLFEGLRYRTAGRDSRYDQVLEFEAGWNEANPAWVFKAPMTLAQFTARREAIVTGREVAHAAAGKAEQHERARLHKMADGLNRISVDWYEVATATFAQDTVAGQLVRTIPTTYDPNRAPGKLSFTAHLSSAPNQVHLIWRAARGERFYIRAQAPGAASFDVILEGITDTEWIGMGMAPGQWRFQGYATNQHGQGADSEVVEMAVAAAAAA